MKKNEAKSDEESWCLAPEVGSDDESMGLWDNLSGTGGGVFKPQTQVEIQDLIENKYKSSYYESVMELEDEQITEEELNKITVEREVGSHQKQRP